MSDPALKKARGCDHDTAEGIDIVGGGVIKRCPFKLVTERTRDVMKVFNRCRSNGEYGYLPNGILPSHGGALSQPYTLMTAFDIIDSTISELAKADKKRKRRGQ